MEHQSKGLLRRVKPLTSAAVSGQGSDPTEPLPTDTQSQLPNTETHTVEPEGEITTVGTLLGMDTDTGTPPSGMSSLKKVVKKVHLIKFLRSSVLKAHYMNFT